MQRIKNLPESYEVNYWFDYEDGREKLSVMLPDQIYAETVIDYKKALNQVSQIITACSISDESPWDIITIGIKSRYERDNYAGKISMYRSRKRKYKYPYAITVVGFEKKEAEWLKKISAAMKADDRFEGYKINFIDYSNMYIY